MNALVLKVVDTLDETVATCISCLGSCARDKDDDYKALLEAPENDLARHLGQSERLDDMVARRLKGQDIDTFEDWIEVLSNCEFSTDDSNDLTANDAKLLLAYKLYMAMSLEEKAKHALDHLYNGDG